MWTNKTPAAISSPDEKLEWNQTESGGENQITPFRLFQASVIQLILSKKQIWQQANEENTPEIMHVYAHSYRDVHTGGGS